MATSEATMTWKWRDYYSGYDHLYWRSRGGLWSLFVTWRDGYWRAEAVYAGDSSSRLCSPETRRRDLATAKRAAEEAVPMLLRHAHVAILQEMRALGVEVPDED